jgi:uncharacterized protein (TIGR00369 family)
MDKFQETVDSVLSKQNLGNDYLNIIPDVTSERVMSSIFAMLMDVYNSKMPFNKLLGIEVTELNLERAVISIHSREDLYGNYIQKILHGGVISAVIDLSGGIIAQAHALSKMNGLTIGQMMQRFSMMSTLNMRVDYLRPGAGNKFECVSRVVRAGNKVAVVQMEMIDAEGKQTALGTGSYLIG